LARASVTSAGFLLALLGCGPDLQEFKAAANEIATKPNTTRLLLGIMERLPAFSFGFAGDSNGQIRASQRSQGRDAKGVSVPVRDPQASELW